MEESDANIKSEDDQHLEVMDVDVANKRDNKEVLGLIKVGFGTFEVWILGRSQK